MNFQWLHCAAASGVHSVGLEGPPVDIVGSFHVVVHKISKRARAGEVGSSKLRYTNIGMTLGADGAKFAQHELAFVSATAWGGEALTKDPRCHLGRSVCQVAVAPI